MSQRVLTAAVVLLIFAAGSVACSEAIQPVDSSESQIAVRAIYGGIPGQGEVGSRPADYGVNAVFIGSGSVTRERVEWVKSQGALIFAEFNTLHRSDFLETHPDAAPIGLDGRVSPPPHGWQGICPSHPGYRSELMQTFRQLLREFQLDGVWLDYHHSHASWERETPVMPDTCFCPRCLGLFASDASVQLPEIPEEAARMIMNHHEEQWTRWRCDLLTDWVREFRSIIDEERPDALLGTFHNPWSDEDFDGARIRKLAIDLKSQAAYVDVFSPMPYHARFGHSDDPVWIAERVRWLGDYLNVEGIRGEKTRIWPIVQISDWGESVQAEDVADIIEYGTVEPATGVIVFAWGSLKEQPDKVTELWRVFRQLAENH